MKFFRGFAVAAVLAASALGVSAASATDFTGPRVDVHVGRDKAATETVSNVSGSLDGLTYGVQVGYDVSVNDQITVGLEGGVDFANTKDVAKSGTLKQKFDASRDLSVGVRLGAKASDNLLIYGGVAYTNAAYQDALSGAGAADYSVKTNLDGYRLSGGVLLGLTDKLALKGEYRWADYEQDVTRSSVLVGASYRF